MDIWTSIIIIIFNFNPPDSVTQIWKERMSLSSPESRAIGWKNVRLRKVWRLNSLFDFRVAGSTGLASRGVDSYVEHTYEDASHGKCSLLATVTAHVSRGGKTNGFLKLEICFVLFFFVFMVFNVFVLFLGLSLESQK